jgi:hypothetical protein
MKLLTCREREKEKEEKETHLLEENVVQQQTIPAISTICEMIVRRRRAFTISFRK